jgi:hypothetical protein
MSNSISFEKAPKSESRSLPFLPRIGFVFDVGGRRLSFRNVPLLETLLNMRRTKKGLIETSVAMLREVELPALESDFLKPKDPVE